MNVSLTIMEDADGNPSIAYFGRDCTEALATLEREIATGKFVIGHVVRDPTVIKSRRPPDPVPEAAPAPPEDTSRKGRK